MILLKREVTVKLYAWPELEGIERDLFLMALIARDHSYAPYSHYRVGAAILWDNLRVSAGCNVENAVFNVLHAERCAIGTGIERQGPRRIVKVAVIGAPEDEHIQLPSSFDVVDLRDSASRFEFKQAGAVCGQCAQDVLEFAGGTPEEVELIDFRAGFFVKITLADLLTGRFGPEDLGVKCIFA